MRYYKLRDFLFPDVSKDASEGEIWLYDPDLEKVGEWDIAGLECLIHEEADGLEASAEGIQHALLVPVPIALMDEGGTYRFVAHIEDDHAGDYREHRNRWALDLNSAESLRTFYIEDDWMVTPQGVALKPIARHPKFKEAFRAGGWVVKYAPYSACTPIPYHAVVPEDDMGSFSEEHFDYYSSRNGRPWPVPDPDPYRFVHVIGAAFPDPALMTEPDDHFYGLSVFGYEYLCSPERWSYLFVQKLREDTKDPSDPELLMLTVHEVGHSAFALDDHDPSEIALTDTPCPSGPYYRKECVMCQGVPNSICGDYRFCAECRKKIRSYGGYCFVGFW